MLRVGLSLVSRGSSRCSDLASAILPRGVVGLLSRLNLSLAGGHSLLTVSLICLTSSLVLASQKEDKETASSRKPVQVTLDPDSSYVLGPRDQISIQALEAEEINSKSVRIDGDGNVDLPLVGRIRAAGLTAQQFEAELSARLKTYIYRPDIVVNVTDFASQPVTVMGAVTTPGVHQLQGRKNLFELLSMAGGVRADAGSKVKVTRRKEWGPIPLPSATKDASGQFTIAEVSLRSIMDATNPEENISIQPYDVITVPRAAVVYVLGEVQKPGAFVLGDQETITALQALTLAGGLGKSYGLTSTPAPQSARILRLSSGSSRTEIPVDLKAVLSGKQGDVSLQADDILFIPNNAAAGAMKFAVQTAISAAVTAAFYRSIRY
jgi:polysaccharide biosynthesis/export protein